MAVSSVGSPGDFNPAYSPVVYYFNSTNKNQPGFRYVVDLYYFGTSTKIAEFRVAPRPGDGYGYIDLSRILQSVISYNFSPTNTTTLALPQSYVEYDLKIGEEYVVSYNLSSLSNNGGSTQVTTTAANTFVLGSQVVLNETNIPLTGLFTVTNDVSTTQNVIDLPWNAAYGVTVSGTITYADNRKTITRDLLTYSKQVAYNGVLSFADFRTYNNATYKLTGSSTTDKLVTSMPDEIWAYESQDIWLNYAPFYSTAADRLFFNNSNGDFFSKSIVDGTVPLKQVAVGPHNAGTLTPVVGTGALIKPDTEWYEILVVSSSATVMSQRYRINIKRDCKIENYEIVFQDRMGSFNSFAFPYRAKTITNTTREQYTNQLGNLSGGKFTYGTTDLWNTMTNIDVERKIELNSDYFKSDAEMEYFNEMLTSPITFIKINGVYYQCIVDTNTNEINSLRNKKLQRKTITVQVVGDNINI